MRTPATTRPATATTSSPDPRALARDVARALRFERETMALAAGRSEADPLGTWVRSADHPRMWSLNQLYVEGRHRGLTAEALLAALDAGLAGAEHRRAVVTDDATGMGVADGMRAAGFDVAPLMVMVLDTTPPPPPPGLAREIDEPAMAALEQRLVAAGDVPEHDREVVLAGHAYMRAVVPGTRTFAGVSDGADACMVTLYQRDGIAQPEDVETHPEHRRRGLAAAAVSLAVREALAADPQLVFILCHADTGPFPLYAGLGFRAAGRAWTFTRPGR